MSELVFLYLWVACYLIVIWYVVDQLDKNR